MSSTNDGNTKMDLERYRGGDDDALRRLFERHYSRVTRIARSRLGFPLRKRVDVEDVVQEVFVDALVGIERFEFRGDGSFANWLATLTVRRILKGHERETAQQRDVHRDRAIESMQMQFRSGSMNFDLPADESSVSSKAARSELVSRVEECLQALEPQQQEAIRLRDWAECTYGEIAEILGLSNDMAATRLYVRATRTLARCLESSGGGT